MHSMQWDTGDGWHLGCGLPETCCNVTMHLPQYFQREVSIDHTSLDTQTLWELALTSPLNHAIEQQSSQRALWVRDMIRWVYELVLIVTEEPRVLSLFLHGRLLKAHAV